MPKVAKELRAAEVRRISRPGNHAVGGVNGLLLRISTEGARSWILRVVVGAKRRDIGLGSFPTVDLATAREEARAARGKIKAGIDPVEENRANRAATIASQLSKMTFEQAAKQYIEANGADYKDSDKWFGPIENHAIPAIGSLYIDEIKTDHIEAMLKPLWVSQNPTARKVQIKTSKVLSYAFHIKGIDRPNPARWEGNLSFRFPDAKNVHTTEHFASLPYDQMSKFMADLAKVSGQGARALELLVLTAARSANVRLATWSQFDLKKKLWIIPGSQMKNGKEFHIPLSDAAIRALPEEGDNDLLFANSKGKPLSDMTISAVCKRMGIAAVPHGFRSTFKDWAREQKATVFADEVSELALSHINSDATRAAYARSQLIDLRRDMMTQWANYVSSPSGKPAGEVVPIRKRGSSHG